MASGIFGCVLQIGKVIYEPAMEHGDYLVHYKSHVDNFKNEVESLKNIRGDVIILVDDACWRNEVLKADVEEWLKSVEEVKEDARRLVNGVEGSAGCLSGWLPNCYVRYNLGKEAKQKMNDVKELQSIGRGFRSVGFRSVSSSLPRPSTDSMLAGGDYVVFASREVAVEEIMKALYNEAIGTIGVYGMGGVGKTTLMKEMGKLVKTKGLYDDVVMVEVSSEPKPPKIQEEIAGQLGLKLNEYSQAARKGELLERLQGTKTLVILDNVWKQLDLVEIGIPCGPNRTGCKIMLTTRDRDVCNMHGSQTMIEVRFVTEMESLDLFKVTIGSDVDSSIMKDYAKGIVKECGGIPLLLAAVGTALREKDKMVWADALTRLRKGSLIGEIFPGLQLSYEFLQTNEIKSCFLFCCLFPEGSNIDIGKLMIYGFGEELLDDVETLKEARERVHSLIDKLKARCLLLDGYKEGYVKMHDCVRDVTRSIASKDENGFLVKAGVKTKDWPRKEKLNQCKRISLIRNEISMLPAEPDCPNLLTLLFQGNYSLKKFPDSFFRGMKSLVVLDLSNTGISSLPCVTTLRVLLLNECFHLTDLSLLGEMEKLEILSLRNTTIRELPEEVGRLSNLKLLDLSYTYLKRLPPNVVQKLRCLEELYMRGSFSAWEVEGTGDGNNASLAEVMSLDRLTMLDIRVKNVECFSQETFSCTNLSRFYVTCGEEYEMKGDLFSMAVKDKSQRNLFRRTSLEISKPVSSFVKFLMERSEELRLVRSKHSDVERWEKMFKYGLPPAPKDLRFLKFCNWANPFLPSCLLQSAKIERLWIVDCQKMQKMVQDEDGDAASPVKPLLASAFENLRFLEVRGCIALKNLLSWKLARALEHLKKLVVEGCNEMEVIITNGAAMDTSVLPRLQEIYLSRMPNLKSFYEGEALLELPSLLLIRVILCSSLKSLPLGPSSATSLQYTTGESILPTNPPLKKRIEPRLEIIGCQIMEKIVPDEDENLHPPGRAIRPSLFENLQFLDVRHCHGFKNLLSWRLARALEQLKELKVQGCNEMEVIIAYGGEVDSSTFPRLHSIHLEDMPKLRCFCEGEILLDLRSLLTIRVIHCSAMKRHLLGPSSAMSIPYMTGESILPSNLPLRMRIEPQLEIIGCQTMEKIVADEYENLPSPIKALWPCLFENLQYLDVRLCHGFKNLLSWRLARALEQLKELKVQGCNEMEVIIGYGGEVDSSTFPRLHSIHLEDMPKLRCFCEGEVLLDLRSLLTIHVIHCSAVKRHLLGPSSALSIPYMIGDSILPSNLPLKMTIVPRLEITGCQTMEKIVPDEYENLPSPVKALRPSLFENLQFLNVKHCHSFKNLLSWRLARALEQLKELKVQGCNEMEVIIGYGGEVDSSTFPRLHSIHLEDMPKLRCFCEGEVLLDLRSLLTIRVIHCSAVKRHLLGPSSALSIPYMTGESILPSNLPLRMRIEPQLEIIGCQTMEKIVVDEYENLPSPIKALWPCLFENLQYLDVQHCHGFKNLLSWRLARALEQLRGLKVQGCNEMEVIIGYGGEVDSSTFPRLQSIHLEDMPKLRCFYEGEVLLGLRSLFTICVIHCSAMKRHLLGQILPSNRLLNVRIEQRLEITGCPTMEKIVSYEDENLSSLLKAIRPSPWKNIQSLGVKDCHGLKNLLSWRVARVLEQLEELKVQGCNEMEVIIGYGGEVDSSTFPRLHSIHLEDMPKLRCFCAGEVLLELRSLLTIRVIHCSAVKRHLLGPSSALSIPYMTGESILPSNLPLKMRIVPRLEIIGCQTMEKIVPDEYENFPSPVEALRPTLFENLQFLNVKHCHGFKNLLSWRLARALEQLKELKVQGCNEMEVIIGYGGEVDSSTFPRLHSIHLEDMPKLRCFCAGEVLLELRSLLTIRVIHCSTVKRHLLGPSSALSIPYMTGESILPSNLPLKMRIVPRLEITGCQTMEKIVLDEYENLPSLVKALRPSLFENLRFLNVKHCHGFKNLLSWRLARALEQLEELKVQGCNEMEVIIEYGGEVDSSTFPRLHSIHLEDMPKLRCFCEGEVLLDLRSLLTIRVIHCSAVKRHLLGPSSALSIPYMTRESIFLSNLPLKMTRVPRLEITGCRTMEKIVPDEYENLPSPVKALRPSLFENLQFLNVKHCHGFKNLLSWRLARALDQLKELKVQGCNEMEVIIGYGGEVDSSTFPRLRSIHLEDMPKLRCFCEGEVLLELQSLLTIRVIHCSAVKRHLLGPSSALSISYMTGDSILPSNLPLKMTIVPRLEITGCLTMEKIVPDEYENLPSPVKALRPSLFENLQFLNVKHCHGFKNLLSWRLARALEQLKELKVQGCNEMEVIIGYGGEVDSSTFPRLHRIHLEDMPKLRCFCEGEVLLDLRSLLTIRVIHCSAMKRHLLGPSSALSIPYITGESILPSNLPQNMTIVPRLEITGCQTMEKIVPDEYENLPSPVKALRPSLFENLLFLNVKHCHGFKNLLSWRLARALEQLKELKVQGCNEMEVIIGYGGEVDSSTFPRLHSIHLEDMPNLRCFCEGEVLLDLRSLLTIRVIHCSAVKRHLLGPSSALSIPYMTGESILPSNLPLKMTIVPRLKIIGCQTVEKIVADEDENVPSLVKAIRPSLFENLQFLDVQHCHGFKNLLSWRLARALEQLKELKVQGCNEMEVIIAYGGEVDSSTFPRLHSIHLEDMPKLRCFCEGEVLLDLRSLLTIRVIHCSAVKRHLLGPSSTLSIPYMTRESILPSNLQLKMTIVPRLEITGCQTMEKIVLDEYENLPSPVKALRPSLFENLQFLNVKHCHGFKNLLSWRLARALEQLKELKVQGCNEMEVIIGYGGEVDSLTFPHLHNIHLEDMPKLRCFCEGEVLLDLRSLLTIRVIDCSTVKRHLLGLSSTLSIPYMIRELILSSNLPLKMRTVPRLTIIGCQTVEKIVADEDENVPSLVKAIRPSSFEYLQFLDVRRCHGIKNLLSWRLARALEQLKELKVQDCNEMEVIIGYGGEVDSSTFPRLHSIHLEDMPKLRSFCEGEVLLVFCSLLRFHVHRCSSLKRLALGNNSAYSLQSMRGVTEWFKALEWADEAVKSRFHDAFRRLPDELWNVLIISIKAVMIFKRAKRSLAKKRGETINE